MAADADRALLRSPSRQSPVAVAFIAWRFIRGLGFIQIAVALAFILRGGLPPVLLAGGTVAAVVALAVMILTWWRFVFSVDGDELLVSKGIVAVERLTIPLDRVQSVSIDQKFLHRPVGLVSVTVDTAGSATAEFEIHALERPKAEALQRLAAGSRRAATSATGAPPGSPGSPTAAGAGPPGTAPAAAGEAGPVEDVVETVIRRTPLELVRIGLTRLPWAGLVALAPLGAVFNDLVDLEVFDFFPDFGDRIGDGSITDSLPGLGLAILAIAAVGFVIAGVIGLILQVVQTLLADWDLHLSRTTTGFRRTAGLLNTTSKASTLTRIQAVRTDQSPAQRWLGIRSLNLPTIGEGDLSVPGTTDAEMARIRDIVFGPGRSTPLDRMISPLAVFVETRNAAVLALFATVGLTIAFGWWGLLVPLLVPVEWAASRRQWRLRRWGITDDRLAESLRFVNTRTAELELIKAQTVRVEQSFFERRRGLATVRVDLAEGHLAVPYIALADAEAVRDRVLYAVESDRRPWM